MLVRFKHTPERGWLEVDELAEMTEIDALKVRLAEKQMALDNAVQFEALAMSALRALKDGTLPLSRIVVSDNGFSIVPAVEEQAAAIAQQADGGTA